MIRSAKVHARRRRARAATLVAALVGGWAAAAAPAPVLAQAPQADAAKTDGRLFGYEKPNPGSGTNETAATWMVFVGLVILGCVSMFRSSKRADVE
ncbi:MAG TPA: hypothetical protein VF796_17920 [Humisphaera sp.]